MVNTYSLAVDGNKQLSPNFKVREFACKDGSDKILIDDVLVGWLQACRDFFNVPVYIGSGYRTPTYNSRIGGADGSNHIFGKAADIDVGTLANSVSPRLVAMFLESLTPRPAGIGLYMYPDGESWVHVDHGNAGKYWLDVSYILDYTYFTSFLPVIRPMTGNWQYTFEATVAQQMLKALDYYHGKIDGKYGSLSSAAVMDFQADNNLIVDGKIGPVTFKVLFREVGSYSKFSGVIL